MCIVIVILMIFLFARLLIYLAEWDYYRYKIKMSNRHPKVSDDKIEKPHFFK